MALIAHAEREEERGSEVQGRCYDDDDERFCRLIRLLYFGSASASSFFLSPSLRAEYVCVCVCVFMCVLYVGIGSDDDGRGDGLWGE